jgi:hypothetical protein
MDSGKVKTIVGVTAGALTLLLLYKMLTRGRAPTSYKSNNPFTCRIDPRAPLDTKQKEALEAVVDFINQNFKG